MEAVEAVPKTEGFLAGTLEMDLDFSLSTLEGEPEIKKNNKSFFWRYFVNYFYFNAFINRISVYVPVPHEIKAANELFTLFALASSRRFPSRFLTTNGL